MNEIKLLLQDIERLRDNLTELIGNKDFNLQDPDIISASQLLNATITKYNEIIKKKIKK